MARRTRCSDAGYVYHVLNRAVGRATIFEKAADYAAFERILAQASAHFAMPVLSYAIMPNHWHLVVKPEHDGTLSKYLQWLTVTHVRKWHSHHHTAGTGPIYQGRFKSFPVQEDDHFLTVCRYVERNACAQPGHASRGLAVVQFMAGCPTNPASMAGPLAGAAAPTMDGVCQCARNRKRVGRFAQVGGAGVPFGEESWQLRTADALGLQSALRTRGRQRLN